MEIRYIEEPLYRLSWDELYSICRDIAQEVHRTFGPDAIVGIARGGLIPSSIIASILRVDLYPCLVTRRRRANVVSNKPEVVSSVSEEVSGRRVLVVDEMVLSGETMRIVTSMCKKQKARVVRTACVWAFGEKWKPTYYGLESSGYVMFPWDFEVILRGKFTLNPVYQEYVNSLEMVGKWKE